MLLLLVYAVLVALGELVAVGLGLYLDTVFPQLSIPIALSLFFGVLVLVWRPALWITQNFLTRKN